MSTENSSLAESLARLKTIQLDVVIPLGPSSRDREKMFPLSQYIPKPLIPIGTRPMIWHILHQIQEEIDGYVKSVYLLLHREKDRYEAHMIRQWVEQESSLPLRDKIQIIDNEDNRLCDRIAKIDFGSDLFLLHFDDILLPSNARLLLPLLKYQVNQEKKSEESLLGTLAFSRTYPLEVGLIKKSAKEGRMYSLVEKSPRILGELLYRKRSGGFEEICVNMAIAIFKRGILDYLCDQGNDIYNVVGSIGPDRLSLFEYKGRWSHVDNIHDFYRIHRELLMGGDLEVEG